MTDYHSVINTAKNGRLIRAEIREYVLGMALYYGFYKDKTIAAKLYDHDPNRDKRIEQCTFLAIKNKERLDPIVYDLNCAELLAMPGAIKKTIKSYVKTYLETEESTILYDTKKFRVYYNRLTWGQEKKIVLTRTIQHIWTDYLAMLFCLYGKHSRGPGWCSINIQQFHMFLEAKDRYETNKYIRKYLKNIVKADCHVADGVIFFETPYSYWRFCTIANFEAKRIYKKLEEGGYLGESSNQKHDAG